MGSNNKDCTWVQFGFLRLAYICILLCMRTMHVSVFLNTYSLLNFSENVFFISIYLLKSWGDLAGEDFT